MNAPKIWSLDNFFERRCKMPRVTFNRLSKQKSTVRRKRTGVLTKSKFKPKTAAANRSLIKSNAYAIRSIRRMMPKPVYTDFQLTGTLYADTTDSPNFTQTIQTIQLLNPISWTAVLREDQNVIESAATLVKRLQLNLRYTMQQSNWAQFTTFIVTLRPDAANRQPTQAGLVQGKDYILSGGQDFNVRLNPAVFKVHYVRNVSLTKNTWVETAANVGQQPFAGNPFTTYRKGQITLQMNIRLRQPTIGGLQELTWKNIAMNQLGPHQRYFLITFITQQAGLQPGEENLGARLDYDALFTCYNAA